MIRKQKEMTVTERPNIRGGIGVIHATNVIEKEDLIGNTRYFARMLFQPGESIGPHPHETNVEFYYILSGIFEVSENDTNETVKAGDVVMTGNGDTHSIRNAGEEAAELLAVIVENNGQ